MIYADANVIIRLLEGDVATRAPLEARLLPLRGTTSFLHTSRLSWLECRVKPLRANDAKLLALYDAFFSSVEVEVLDRGRAAAPDNPAGRGLAGMRERVGLYGGELTVGPTPDGGYRVWARLPVTP